MFEGTNIIENIFDSTSLAVFFLYGVIGLFWPQIIQAYLLRRAKNPPVFDSLIDFLKSPEYLLLNRFFGIVSLLAFFILAYVIWKR